MVRLSKRNLERLKDVVRKYRNASPKEIRHFETYSENDVWKQFIKQIIIAGNSKPGNKLDECFDETLTLEIFESMPEDELRVHVHEVIRWTGSRFAGKDVETCRFTRAILHNYHFIMDNYGSPKQYLRHLEKNYGPHERYEVLRKDMKQFGLKSCRDFLKDFGMAANAIAFDSRLINILRTIDPSIPESIQQNACKYDQLERQLLDEVCTPLEITGSELDSILFLNYEAIMSDLRGI